MARSSLLAVAIAVALLAAGAALVSQRTRLKGNLEVPVPAASGSSESSRAERLSPALRHAAAMVRAAQSVPRAPTADPPNHPRRVVPQLSGGLTEESERAWLDETSTTHDIDLANAIDVCTCPDSECVRGLQSAYFERRRRAPLGTPSPEEAEAVREMRVDCLMAISKAAYAGPLAPALSGSGR